jgi:hypothetical protein
LRQEVLVEVGNACIAKRERNIPGDAGFIFSWGD